MKTTAFITALLFTFCIKAQQPVVKKDTMRVPQQDMSHFPDNPDPAQPANYPATQAGNPLPGSTTEPSVQPPVEPEKNPNVPNQPTAPGTPQGAPPKRTEN